MTEAVARLIAERARSGLRKKMRFPAAAIRTLSQNKELGVKLLIDNFGTGHSSLTYLQKAAVPVDTIQIDQSFVGGMTTNKGFRSAFESFARKSYPYIGSRLFLR